MIMPKGFPKDADRNGMFNHANTSSTSRDGEATEGPGCASLHSFLGLTAELLSLTNALAKAFARDNTLQKRIYDAKNHLLSALLVRQVPGVKPTWQRKHDGSYLVAISIGNRRAVSCPFWKLTLAAQHAVARRIGGEPA